MLNNAYLLANISADTAETKQIFDKFGDRASPHHPPRLLEPMAAISSSRAVRESNSTEKDENTLLSFRRRRCQKRVGTRNRAESLKAATTQIIFNVAVSEIISKVGD